MSKITFITVSKQIQTTEMLLQQQQQPQQQQQQQQQQPQQQQQLFNDPLPGTTPVSRYRTLINPTCHPHCPQIPHKHSQPSFSDLPVYL